MDLVRLALLAQGSVRLPAGVRTLRLMLWNLALPLVPLLVLPVLSAKLPARMPVWICLKD